MFESFANSERYKTLGKLYAVESEFESFANSERYKTAPVIFFESRLFESFANSERYKTIQKCGLPLWCLRALLIQKDTKL